MVVYGVKSTKGGRPLPSDQQYRSLFLPLQEDTQTELVFLGYRARP